MSAIEDWGKLMTEWNERILNAPLLKEQIPSELRKKGWLGRPGATQEQIQQLESRLNYSLPPSYRSFLAFTNGWEGRLTSYIHRLWSVDDVDWFSRRNQDWIDATREGENYYSRPVSQVWSKRIPVPDPATSDSDRMQTSIEISDTGTNACFLLNPSVVDPDGEWEAYFLSTWNPGIRRYDSFQDLMQNTYAAFLRLNYG